MIRLKSRTESPIGGFMFIDAAISPEPMTGWGFSPLVVDIINRRQANPRFNLNTDYNAVAAELDLQNAQRMQTINGGQYYIVDDGVGGAGPNVPFPSAPRSGLRVVQVAESSKDVVSGAQILRDWIGDGGIAVDPKLSEPRAATCKDCPKNGKGDWTTYFTVPAAAIIRRQLAQRDGLALTTPDDGYLGVCTACNCSLKLKVHVPLVHILKHTRPEVLAQLDPRCWMLKEKENLTDANG